MPVSARWSHARAKVQCRFTVAGATSSSAAVSWIESPAKYRSSTIFAFSGANERQRLERLIEPLEINSQVDGLVQRVLDGRTRQVGAAALRGLPLPCVIHEDAAHRHRRGAVEVPTALEPHASYAGQTDVQASWTSAVGWSV